MQSKIAMYRTHDHAIEAVKKLKNAGFPIDRVSLIGEAHIIDDHLYLRSIEKVKSLPLAIGGIAGVVTGVLTGIGLFMIPGFGFLYGAGAIVGFMAGLDIGILGGGIAAILTHMGIREDEVLKYEEHIKGGRFLVIAKGTPTEIDQALKILHPNSVPLELGENKV
jgi:hypothetical protein